ncbi:hypothetical protein FRC04_003360 [Tulasnella sp. 424]|nr:hypothetical protein FRC04_003360 [Tulasnella sp. 424]KAG8977175.1 hypothetical protein FRC05_002174 [Tulasnella sp. 425]
MIIPRPLTATVPPELWLTIIDSLYDSALGDRPKRVKEALGPIRLTCRLFRDLALPKLYERVVLDADSDHRDQLLETLEGDERKRKAVQELVIRGWDDGKQPFLPPDPEEEETEIVVPEDVVQRFAVMERVVLKLNRLRSVEAWHSRISEDLLQHVLKSKTLRHLWIYGGTLPSCVGSVGSWSWNSDGTLIKCQNLSKLEIIHGGSYSFLDPSAVFALLHIPTIQSVTVETAYVIAWPMLKYVWNRLNPSEKTSTSITSVHLFSHPELDLAFSPHTVLPFLSDCPNLQDLQVDADMPDDIHFIHLPTLNKLTSFTGSPRVASCILRGAPVERLNLTLSPDDDHVFINALRVGTVPLLCLSLSGVEWDPRLLALVAAECPQLRALRFEADLITEGDEAGCTAIRNPLFSADVVDVLRFLPELETLSLLLECRVRLPYHRAEKWERQLRLDLGEKSGNGGVDADDA